MTTEINKVKVKHTSTKEADDAVKAENYQSRTESIRDSLNKNVEESELKEAIRQLASLKGSSKKKTTDEELEKIREKVFEEFNKKLG